MKQSFGEWSLKKRKVKEELVDEELQGNEVQGRVEEIEDVEEKRWGFYPPE